MNRPQTLPQGEDGARKVVRPRRTLWLAALLGIIAFLPFLLVFTQTGKKSPDAVELTESDQKSVTDGLRMIRPSFSGRTEKGEPYSVRAEWALPNAPKPTRITLNEIMASLKMKDGREIIMTSKRGTFFPKTEKLQLKSGVFARTSDGYTLETPDALVNVGDNSLRADTEIKINGPRGSIRADMLEALDGTDRMVIFTGNVRVVFVPESPPQ